MRLTSPQLKLLREMDSDLRHQERQSRAEPGDIRSASGYISRLLRSGQTSIENVRIAAALNHAQSKLFLRSNGEDIVDWRVPSDVANYLIANCSEEQAKALVKVSIGLAHIVSAMLRNMLQNPSHQEALGYNAEIVDSNLAEFEEALSYLETGEVPGPWFQYPEEHELHQGSPWEDYLTIHNWSGGYADIIGSPRGPGGITHSPFITGMSALGSFLEAFRGDSLEAGVGAVNSNEELTEQHSQHILSTAIERLTPVLGMDRMSEAFREVLIPEFQ